MTDLELFKSGLKKKDITKLKLGQYHFSLPQQIEQKYTLLNSIRAGAVKKDMVFLWRQYFFAGLLSRYQQHAFGYDELLPVSGGHQNNWGGVGMTLVDSLDTLYIMGMRDEFELACRWVGGLGKRDV